MAASQIKRELRDRLTNARDALPEEEHGCLSALVVEKLKADQVVRNAQFILSYQPFRSEVDISAFNAWACSTGKSVAFPLCLPGYRMVAAVPENEQAIISGLFGILAPDPTRSRIVEAEQLDVVVVPCVGFNDERYRLGSGGGYYDRYLPGCMKAHKLGVAFSIQRIRGPFSDPWDIRLDRVITEV